MSLNDNPEQLVIISTEIRRQPGLFFKKNSSGPKMVFGPLGPGKIPHAWLKAESSRRHHDNTKFPEEALLP